MNLSADAMVCAGVDRSVRGARSGAGTARPVCGSNRNRCATRVGDEVCPFLGGRFFVVLFFVFGCRGGVALVEEGALGTAFLLSPFGF